MVGILTVKTHNKGTNSDEYNLLIVRTASICEKANEEMDSVENENFISNSYTKLVMKQHA